MTLVRFLQKFFLDKSRRSHKVSGYEHLSAREIQQLFWDSVCEGDITKARALVAHGADVNAFDVDGHSALYMASLHGRVQMYHWLDHVRERQAKLLETRHSQAA